MDFITHPFPGQEVRIAVRENPHRPPTGQRVNIQVRIQDASYTRTYSAHGRVMPDGTIHLILPQDRSQADDIEAAIRAYLEQERPV